ncbi:MAG: serine/threonine-protein kinase, partial [Planctomycetota bacterium]
MSGATDLDAIVQQQRRDWSGGTRSRLEEYVRGNPELLRDEAHLLDLCYSEILLRQEFGDHPTSAEYIERFPNHADAIRRQFEVHDFLEDFDSGVDVSAADTKTELETHTKTKNSGPCRPGDPYFSWAVDIPGYRVLRLIGQGGTGLVFLADQLSTRRRVAIKVMRAGSAADDELIARFEQETRAAASIRHPGIVGVLDAGFANGQHFLVMEWVEGGTLADQADGGSWSPDRVCEAVMQLADAMDAAHREGIIHRDLKPQNVLIDRDGRLRIVDFGLARFRDDFVTRTGTGQLLGTLPYMAPEQASAASLSPSGDACEKTGVTTDVYGLGAVMYFLLSGQPPHLHGSLTQTLRAVLEESPAALDPSIPVDLRKICLKCLEKSPRDRYASAAALAQDLDRYREGKPVLARPIGVFSRTLRLSKRHPKVAALTSGFVLLLLLAATGAIFAAAWLQRDRVALRKMVGRVQAAESETKRSLAESYIVQAEQIAGGLQAGRREQCVAILEELMALDSPEGLTQTQRYRVRTLTANVFAAVDLQLQTPGEDFPDQPMRRELPVEIAERDLGFEIEGYDFHSHQPLLAIWGGRELRTFDLNHFQLLSSRRHGTGKILSVDWHPVGSTLAVGCDDHFGYVFESTDLTQPTMVMEGARGWMNRVFFLPTGELVTSVNSKGRSRMFDTTAGRELLRWSGRSRRFNGDGIEGSVGDRNVSWSYLPSVLCRRLPAATADLVTHCGSISPDGRRLVLGTWEGLTVWDFTARKRIDVIPLENPYHIEFLDSETLLVQNQLGLFRVHLDASGRCVAVDDLANALARVPNRCFLEHTGASGRFIDKQSDCPGIVTVSRNSVDWTPVAKVNSADDNLADDNLADDNSATDDEINAIVESIDRAWVAQQRGPRQVEWIRRKNRSKRHTMNVGGSIQRLRFSNDSRSLWLLTPRNLVRCDLESGVVRQTIS